MNDMLERAARGISKAHHENPDDYAFGYKVKQLWELRVIDARAALEAIREPTEEMVEAALDDPDAEYCDQCMQSGYERSAGYPKMIWQTMIDHILGNDR